MGVTVGASKIHQKRPTHVENMKKRKRFFGPSPSASSSAPSSGTFNNKQTKITESISNSEMAEAEIQ